MELTDSQREDMRGIIARYPDSRSALGPLLHYVQGIEGYTSLDGVAILADQLGLTSAEVSAMATFYTMYKRHRTGRHHIGVCTNSLCAILGGDAVWEAISGELGVGHDETTGDGLFTLERIECQAACSHAPSCTIDWEFFDDATPASLSGAVATLRAGGEVRSTRGPAVRGNRATETTLAMLDDGLAGEGGAADARMQAGLTAAKERGLALMDQGGTLAPSGGEG